MTQLFQISEDVELDIDGLTWFNEYDRYANKEHICSLCMELIDDDAFSFFRDNKTSNLHEQLRLHDDCFEKRKIDVKSFFWKADSSGVLLKIVPKFLKQEPISDRELNIVKMYVNQWIGGIRNQTLKKLLDAKRLEEFDKCNDDMTKLIDGLEIQNNQKDLLYYIIDDCSNKNISPF